MYNMQYSKLNPNNFYTSKCREQNENKKHTGEKWLILVLFQKRK